eukprot:jgi/Chlat1/1925/Chrsp153S02252
MGPSRPSLVSCLSLLLLASCTIQPASAALARSLSASDYSAAKSTLVTADDGSYGSLRDTCYAAGLRDALKEPAADISITCTYAKHQLVNASEAGSVSGIFHAVCAIEGFHCKDVSVPEMAVSKLTSTLQQANTVIELHEAGSALALLQAKGHLKKGLVSNDILSGVVKKLKGLFAGDGSCRNKAGVKGNAGTAGLAYQLLADVVALSKEHPDNSLLDEIKAMVNPKLFDLVKQEDGDAWFPGDTSLGDAADLVATAQVVRGVEAISWALKTPFKAPQERLRAVAGFLVDSSPVATLQEAFYLIDGITILSDNSISVPLVVEVTESVLASTKDNTVKVALTTVDGKPGPKSKLLATSLARSGQKKADAIISGMELAYADGVYTLDIKDRKLELGAYQLTLDVKPLDSSKAYSAASPSSIKLKVTGAVAVSDVALSVSGATAEQAAASLDADGSPPAGIHRIKFPRTLDSPLKASHLSKLAMAFALKSAVTNAHYAPQQAFVVLSPEGEPSAAGHPHIFIAKTDKAGKKKVYQLDLDFMEIIEKLRYRSGPYAVDLLVGDTYMDNAFRWRLGMLNLTLPAAPPEAVLPPLPDRESAAARLGPLPGIAHMKREPSKRPPVWLSSVFTGLVAIPILGLVAALANVGVNFKAFPTSGLSFLGAVGFHAGIVSIVLLYVAFWLKLNLLQTLPILLVLGVITAIFGHKALSDLADTKLKTA